MMLEMSLFDSHDVHAILFDALALQFSGNKTRDASVNRSTFNIPGRMISLW